MPTPDDIDDIESENTLISEGQVSESAGQYQFDYHFLTSASELVGNGYVIPASGDTLPADASMEYTKFYGSGITSEAQGMFEFAMGVSAYPYHYQPGGYDYSVVFDDVVSNLTFDSATASEAVINIGSVTVDFNATGSGSPGLNAYTLNYYNPGEGEAPSDYAWSTADTADTASDIWLNSGFAYGWTNDGAGSLQLATIIHELGHALGLMHPVTDSLIDNVRYTIMADTYEAGMFIADGYNGSSPIIDDSSDLVMPTGLQMFDILALQDIFGTVNDDTRSDNTVYGQNKGFGVTVSTPFIYTIWDGGGTNVIDASTYTDPVKIDLREGHFSSIGKALDTTFTGGDSFRGEGLAYDNVGIAYNTVIQNGIGANTNGNVIIGNDWNNVLYGGGANSNQLFSDGTVYDGSPGYDSEETLPYDGIVYPWGIEGVAPNTSASIGGDVLIGGGSENVFVSGRGNNVIDGGYNKADIDYATHAILGGALWGTSTSSTYWDSAHQFTATSGTGIVNNISGVALSDIADSSTTGNNVSYLSLNLDDDVVAPYSSGIFIKYAGHNDSSVEPEYFVGKGRGSYVDGTDTLIDIQSITLSAGFNTYSQTGGAAADLLLEGVSGLTGATDYLIKMGSNEGSTVGTVSIDDPNPDSRVFFQSSTGDSVAGIEISHVSTGVAGFVSTDDIVNITTQSLSGESTSTNLDVTAMASGAISMVCVATLPVTGAQFATWVLSDPSELGTMLTPSEFQNDITGTSTPGTLAPPPTLNPTDGSINGMGVPTYASSGEVVDPTIATEIDHPWVVTSSSVSGSTTTANVMTSAEALQMLEPASDIRIVWSGPSSDNLTVYAVSEAKSFTVPDFVAGTAVTGTATLDNVTYGNIAPTVISILASLVGDYEVSWTSPITIPTTSVSVTELLEQMTFSDNTSWNMQSGGLTFTAAVDSQTLYARDGFNDTLVAACNYNTLNGSTGDTTMIAGVACVINNGTGTDTDIFSAGTAPTSYGGDYIYANTSGGTTSIHLQGINPSAVTMWDTTGGALAIQYSSTDVIHIQGGTYNSTTGLTLQGVSEITFDSSYATTISLTGGLNLTATNDSQTLYGTSGGGDTLTANGNSDTLMAFAGTETLVAGPGATLDNGSGTDTDVFSAGAAPISSGGDYVYTDTSGGTANIHLHGIDPSAVTMWDTSGGQLVIQYSSTDQIHALDGTYSSTTGLTLAGLNEITFDSSYATTWDTTGGLHLTAASDYQTLYGTSGGGDTLTASGTGVTLMAFAGGETLVAGHGAQIYNGTGNDIDVINSGSSPTSSTATIFANASGGSDNVIALHDVVAADITMWDTTGGNLIIATPTDQFTVAGGSYNGTTGFAAGNIDHIALDDSSTISLQGSLNLTAVSDSQTIYGTGHGDNLTAAGNYDNLYGIAGNNTMTGDSGTTSFYGGSGNDTMVAGSGTNYMTMGTGADEIKIESASSSTTVSGFSVSNGDTIHVEDVISSYDPVHDAIANFVQETTSGSNTQFSVDPTGSASFTAGPILTLSGVTGLDDVATLVAHGTLIVHA